MDLSSDYKTWDNVEAVSYEVAARGAGRPDSVRVAKRRPVRGAQKSPSGGVYVGYECRWLIPQAVLTPGLVPKPADVVIDGELTRWTVLTVESNKWRQTWALGCVDLVLANDLRDVIALERAGLSYDGAGVAVKLFPPAAGSAIAGIAARVQLVTAQQAEERGLRYGEGRYDVTVDRQLAPDVAEDRVKWVDAAGAVVYLDIEDYHNPQRIDELPVLTCRRKT